MSTSRFATHAAALPGFTTTPCCGVPPARLPRYHTVTLDLRAVTCQGHPAAPVRELIAITLTGTRRPRTPSRRFLPHGDDDGHVYDERCALCAGEARLLADSVSAALTAAFPHIDVRNLRAAKPRVRNPRTPAIHRSPLRTLIWTTLITTPRPAMQSDSGFRPHRQPDGHRHYDRRCALCAGDADTLATAIDHALGHALPCLIQPARRRRRSAPEGRTPSAGARQTPSRRLPPLP